MSPIDAAWTSIVVDSGYCFFFSTSCWLATCCWNCDTRPSKPWISNLKNHLTINQHLLKIPQKTRWLIYKSSSHKLWISNLEDTILKPFSLESPDFSMNFHGTQILFGQGVPSKVKPPVQQPTGLHMSPWAASDISWPAGRLSEPPGESLTAAISPGGIPGGSRLRLGVKRARGYRIAAVTSSPSRT